MSCGDVMQGDGLRARDGAVLRESGDRRIAQACNASKHWGCGVLPSGTWSRCWGLPGDWRMDESLNKGRVGKPGFRNIYPAKGSERADCTARHGALPSGPQPCRETSAAEGSENVGRSAEHQPDAPFGSQRGADWERRQVGSSDSRRGGRQRAVLPRTGTGWHKLIRPKAAIGKGCSLNTCVEVRRGLRQGLPSTRTWRVGPRDVSGVPGMTSRETVVKIPSITKSSKCPQSLRGTVRTAQTDLAVLNQIPEGVGEVIPPDPLHQACRTAQISTFGHGQGKTSGQLNVVHSYTSPVVAR